MSTASGTLRQNVRRLEQDRKRLKERIRAAELDARALLTQARGEVAAARRALQERQVAQERELAGAVHRYETEQARLRERIDAARAEFSRTLLGMAARAPLHVLQGRTVTVTGVVGDPEPYHLLVESLGAALVAEGGEVVLAASAGFAAIERELRSLALQRVLIKCDGLYRKKDGRPGIAMSGVQVHLGGESVHEHSDIVCCGPATGSLMAEYGAVAMALSWLLAVGPTPTTRAEIWSDCRSLLARLRRERNPRRKVGCVMLHKTVRRLIRQLREKGCEVQFRWVPRAQVHAVDRLCDRGYRELTWYHRWAGRPIAPLQGFLRTVLRPDGRGQRRSLTPPVRQRSLPSVARPTPLLKPGQEPYRNVAIARAMSS